MSPHLLNILRRVSENQHLSDAEKKEIENAVKEADRQEQLNQFKIDRAADDRRTLSIMLEESLEDLEHKRKAVEEKNHNLEIEAALERVRTVAMSMTRAEDLLSICETMFHELKKLGFDDLRNAMINIHYDEKQYLLNYDYAETAGKTVTTVIYNSHPIVNNLVNHAKQSSEGFTEQVYAGEALEEWRAFRKGNGEADDPGLSTNSALYYYFYSIGTGAVGVSSFSAANQGQLKVLKRFRNVFDLAYRRYVDIANAEAQARESQIQLALERVRARTMAMQKSEELHEVIQLVFDQLHQLNFNIDVANFFVDYRETNDLDLWLAVADAQYPMKIYIPYFENPVFDRLNKAKEKSGLYTDILTKAEKDSFFRHFFKYVPDISAERQAAVFDHPGFARSAALMKNTVLSIINYRGVPFSEAENNTLMRFGQAFDQTYTRFNDLKQAEAQMREAEIQLGLERVRARAMAMQKSEELSDLAATLIAELSKLDMALSWCLITILDEATWSAQVWRANSQQDQAPLSYYLPFADHPFQKAIMQAWKERQEKWSYVLQGVEKKALDDYMFIKTDYSKLPEQVQAGIRAADPAFFYFSFGNFGGLQVGGPKRLSDESLDILARFGKVFDLTYTRFYDLKQAEAHTKEAQIELAMERIRARAMAMHSSSELTEVANVLREQMGLLNQPELEVSAVHLYNDDSETFDSWYTVPSANDADGKIRNGIFTVPKDCCALIREMMTMYRSPVTDYTIVASSEQMQEWFEILLKAAPVLGKNARFRNPGGPKTNYFHFSDFGGGSLVMASLKEPSEEVITLQRRAASVLDLAYRRFLDLKKAETQAREAQIEAALEKVRSRTMGMQHSEELREVIQLIFEQLKQLNFNIDSANFALNYKESDDFNLWLSSAGQSYPAKVHTPYVDLPIFNRFIEAKKNGVDFLTENYSFEEKNAFFDHFFKHVQGVTDERKEFVMGTAGYARSTVLMKNVTLSMQNYAAIPYSEEENAALRRFGKVFEQTYTRFLDLQQAEAQAREAKIEAGLERVRAKAMAMQTSEELNELIGTVFIELTKLDVVLTRCLIMIFDPETKGSRWWMANSEAPEQPMNYRVQYHTHPANAAYLKAWKERILKWRYDLKGKVKKTWDDFLFVETELSHLPDFVIAGMKAPDRVILSASFNNFGCLTLVSLEPLSDGHFDLLLRFAKVFDMSYTRFNDMKQAEAQAREAKIQLSLERVRAAAMAMHNSKDVGDATAMVFSEFHRLGITTLRCGVCIIDGPAKQMEVWSASSSSESVVNMGAGRLNMEAHPLWRYLLDSWHQKETSFSYELAGKELADYYSAIRNASTYRFSERNAPDQPLEASQFCNCYLFNEGCLFTFTQGPFSAEANQVLEKFAAVFGLTYRRYLDLTKAEAQARESHIELSLERVRAKTMAMHTSADVGETVATMFDELMTLGVETTARLGVIIVDQTQHMEVWTASAVDGKKSLLIGRIDMRIHPLLQRLHSAWTKKELTFSDQLAGEDLLAYYRSLNNSADYPVQFDLSELPAMQEFNAFLFAEGAIFIFSLKQLPVEVIGIFKRFAGVFGQTYRRYLDLQKAEAQAREAKIEVALERVRSRAMAMQKSEDLAQSVAIIFEELDKLDLGMLRCGIGILDKEKCSGDIWTTTKSEDETVVQVSGDERMDIHPLLLNAFNAWISGAEDAEYVLEGEDLADFYKALNDTNFKLPDSQSITAEASGYKQYYYAALFQSGGLYAFRETGFTAEAKKIMKRFADVFDFTYTRFNDLKQAEAQARESNIELSLERVRAKTMAMHSSDDVGDTVATMFDELVKLGVDKTARSGIGILDDTVYMEVWSASSAPNGDVTLMIGRLDTTVHPLLQGVHKAWKNKEPRFTYELAGSDQKDYATAINNSPDYPVYFDFGSLPSHQFNNCFFFPEGTIFVFSLEELLVEISNIFKRFAGVFGQTYRRYLDLKKAEEQAYEAKIEAALERVRSRAMAMRSSSDLNATTNVVFVELRKLGVDLVRCGVGLMEKSRHFATIHTTTHSSESDGLIVLGTIDMDSHPVCKGIYQHWENGEEYFPALEGENLRTYYESLHESGVVVPEWISGEKQYGYFFPFGEGSLYAWSEKQESEATIKTLRRFTSVIGLTYTRYQELQKAEITAKEAVKQASLDRVRAEIASMRTRGDLERITPLIWDELTILGIPFIRCGVFIMDEEQRLIHTFLSTPDGKAIGAFHIPFDTSGNFEKMVDSWRHNVPYIDHWKEKAFSQFADTLVKQGAISSKAQYMDSLPKNGVHLNFLPFLQGMLYVGNVEPLTNDDISLIQAVAEAFSTAYARYEDFNKLELAKQEVEITLTDLKTAQTRLIQSEKMASLGELTAGIAHEIQNPLNFVNNFSEVNQEMLEELKAESEKPKAERDEELEIELINSLIENEQKINHHGKRADGIVKGMLQHSRTTGGEKLPTNINSVAEEYMRLSYHGLRAKDKSFNAEIVMHLDPDLPKIMAVGQDIGRVVLNLFNNAFYAVNQKKKTAGPGYMPTVTLETFYLPAQVAGGLRVKDNGMGMPDHVKEKIMQPFFTTKPTGEGTGLGLSLTYDMVVKGHGGSIEVNSVEGEGSEFIITLPGTQQ